MRNKAATRAEGVSSNVARSPPAALESARPPAPDPLAMPAGDVKDDPQAWLRFIEALLDEQNRDAAKYNLRAFRKRYPDFPLPASLVPLAAALGTERP
jgi:hypothetical protein